MLAAERRAQILEILQQKSSVDMGTLCQLFNTTRETIRTDLKRLETEGLLKRTHGGAVAVSPTWVENPFLMRAARQPEAKLRIGRMAASLISPGESIALDGSSTSLCVARALPPDLRVTVITNSIPVVADLMGRPPATVVCSGGTLRVPSLVFVGEIAERAFREHHVDKLFIGSRGVTTEAGLTDSYEPEVEVKRAMLDSAEEVILVADASKFGYVGFISVAPIARVHTVVTDRSMRRDTAESFRSLGINVLIAE